jgi:hypothetical protein
VPHPFGFFLAKGWETTNPASILNEPLEMPALYQGTTSQAAEKVGESSEIGEKHPSGAKAHVDSAALMARLKSCPFKAKGFSAACKVVPFQSKGFFRSLFSRAANAAK